MTADDLAALRGGLLAFCYQLLGSPFDAEDAVQDTMERAWRAREAFEPAIASLSTWTFRIARNVCFDRLRESPRRPLPRDLSDPGIDVGAPLVPALDVPWLTPPTAAGAGRRLFPNGCRLELVSSERMGPTMLTICTPGT